MINQIGFLLLVPLGLAVYYLVLRSSRARLWFLCLASLGFYASGGWQFLLLLIGLSAVTFWLARWKRSTWGILLNLLALGLFKYWNFGVSNLEPLLTWLGAGPLLPFLSIGLPLGISFYVFKHIGYLVETRQGHYPASRDLLAFLAYSAFFPQILAGPLSDYQKTASQFEHLPDRLSSTQTTSALLLISIGLVKKMMLADTLAASLGSQDIRMVQGVLPAWYLVSAYACQLYFDFSGYTDIALGLASLFGVSLPPNFNNPYRAVHIGQFWERWHISLSTWFRFYLFSPISRSLLRNSRVGGKELAQTLSTLATMALIGLWHGAAWTFVLWGGYHGLLLSLNTWLRRRSEVRLPTWMQRVVLVVTLLIGWAIFMSPDLSSLGHLLGQMAGLGGLGSPAMLVTLFQDPGTLALLFGIPAAFSGRAEGADLINSPAAARRLHVLAWGLLAALSILWMGGSIQFLYMQF